MSYRFNIILTLVLALGVTLSCGLATAQTTNRVDLLWEAETYTPPLYRGHSAASTKSKVIIVADTEFYNSQGNQISHNDLLFKWEKDGRRISSVSGAGERQMTFTTGAEGLAHQIKVTVTSPNGELLSKETSIPVIEPRLMIYEDKPSTGLARHRARTGIINLTRPEITLSAEPFFFSHPDVLGHRVQFSWSLNGEPIILDQNKPWQVTLIAPEGRSGSNELRLAAKALDKLLQETTAKLSIQFNQPNFDF
ncbi:MAG: hypothetical protein U9M92_01495 [Patescibacteria group bacterium]|nr:hypothetical protein [Patescibacteria group bacterium]